jgi:hypothetical protein
VVPTFLAKHMCAFNDGTYETMKHIDKLVNARGLLRFHGISSYGKTILGITTIL